jgi:hypothetical protein
MPAQAAEPSTTATPKPGSGRSMRMRSTRLLKEQLVGIVSIPPIEPQKVTFEMTPGRLVGPLVPE